MKTPGESCVYSHGKSSVKCINTVCQQDSFVEEIFTMRTVTILENKFLAAVCVYIVPLLLIVVFAYTGLSKLIAHQLFLSQIRHLKLPFVLSNIASYALPTAELMVAVMLCFSSTKNLGLWASVLLMGLFTGYTIFVLAGKNIPCSCGGVLAAMTWTQHLYFNIALLLFAVVSTYYHNLLHVYKKGRKLKTF